MVALHVSAARLHRIDNFLAAYLATDDKDRPVRLANGSYDGSLFYDSAATYDGLQTCNTWVAEGLAAAGLPVTSRFVIFAWQVMDQTRALARRQAQAERPASVRSANQGAAAIIIRSPP